MSYSRNIPLSLKLENGYTKEDMLIAAEKGFIDLWTFTYNAGLSRQVFGFMVLNNIVKPDKSELLQGAVEDFMKTYSKGKEIKSPVGLLQSKVFFKYLGARKEKLKAKFIPVEIEQLPLSSELKTEPHSLDKLNEFVETDREKERRTSTQAARIEHGISLLERDYELDSLRHYKPQTSSEEEEVAANIERLEASKVVSWQNFAKAHLPKTASDEDIRKAGHAAGQYYSSWKKQTLEPNFKF